MATRKPVLLELDDRQYARAVRDLQKITGASLEDVLRFQTGTVAKKAASLETSARKKNNAKNAVKGALYFLGKQGSYTERGDAYFTIGTRKVPPLRIWYRKQNGQVIFAREGASITGISPLTSEDAKARRFNPSGSAFETITSQFYGLPDEARKRKKSLDDAGGLNIQAWLQAASDVTTTPVTKLPPGMSKKKVTEGLKARTRDGKRYINGKGGFSGKGQKGIAEIRNDYPYNKLTQGGRVLKKAMKARSAAVIISMEKGVGNDMELVAKRFPGLVMRKAS